MTHRKDNAIETWNTRPIEDQLKSENDKLRADNERLREVITKISGIKIHVSGQERYIQLQRIISMCEEALNEVTK